VFKDNIQRRIFEFNRDEESGGENYVMKSIIFYFLSDIFRMIESRRMRWLNHVALKVKCEICVEFWLLSLKEETTWKT
jgi:hypothetical protein